MSEQVRHILIVEDSETQALKLMMFLEEQGWEVSWAATATEGLQFLSQEIPDLIVVDFFLPGMQGDAFCRQVRLMAATRAIPILMLTAAESDDAQVQLLDSGADDFLPKSVGKDVLLLRLQTLLKKKQSYLNQPHSSFHQAKILAIDDSATYLAFLTSELEQDGYQVLTATNGAEGLAVLEQHQVDCVLVDLIMPEMDGIAVCQELSQRNNQELSPILVLMLTARDQPDELARALEAGADDFVGKSSDMTVIKGRVRALLRRKLSQDENQRLLQEMIQSREMEAQHARKAQEAAEAKASMALELQVALKQLESSKTELEKIAMVTAHDLQEPLRLILNYSELLGRRFEQQLGEKGQRYLDFMATNSQRMQQQVQSLLSYLSASTGELPIKSLELAPLIEASWASCLSQHDLSDAELSLQGSFCVQSSPEHLKLLFGHLLDNAIRYRSPERPLQVQIVIQELESTWQIGVQDNGIGIAQPYFNRIFEIFQQIDKYRDLDTIGIGLAICRKIVERLQGEIELSSEPGQGTHFYFSLAKRLFPY